ncbi:hypothetical protein OHZ10_29280 [Burkholderia arboris]|uniref:Uncharacterized protein n=1 Tax=Burkholderia arboris TaxID=488730 RepID=A0ABZ3DN34_9BURK
MNCKRGDLAVTTGMVDPSNNDVIVEVVSFAFSDSDGVIWYVKHLQPMFDEFGEAYCEGIIYDCNLRPISGVPLTDDVEDEVTA